MHCSLMQFDFVGKVVMDVGAGSGILSLFAAQVCVFVMLVKLRPSDVFLMHLYCVTTRTVYTGLQAEPSADTCGAKPACLTEFDLEGCRCQRIVSMMPLLH